ncbi:hypothetical protein RchiOBHm_Chr6g0273851 [Rosa chinensis]|uniref:Transmembrane protein n=1 Tax=Rosa chinensis TaxID=74649 RepID=A0A2P6PRK8_ROSCH|nr:hypothetical protein RchiOBHm_Chr6g0273851 [Rosa chinensis]
MKINEEEVPLGFRSTLIKIPSCATKVSSGVSKRKVLISVWKFRLLTQVNGSFTLFAHTQISFFFFFFFFFFFAFNCLNLNSLMFSIGGLNWVLVIVFLGFLVLDVGLDIGNGK